MIRGPKATAGKHHFSTKNKIKKIAGKHHFSNHACE